VGCVTFCYRWVVSEKTKGRAFDVWQANLKLALEKYDRARSNISFFYIKLLLFFVLINAFCYWWAMVTAFPGLCQNAFPYYFRVQFPVAILGGAFDSLSFFITIYIIQKAAVTKNKWSFAGHLSVDLLIAVAATFWVLYVFAFASYFVRSMDAYATVALQQRQAVYERRALHALYEPASNLKNIYFGIVMGISAILPTCFHAYLFFRSMFLKQVKGLMGFESLILKWLGKYFRVQNGNRRFRLVNRKD